MEQINFQATDGVLLNGFLHKSDIQTKKVIVAVHGMGSNCFKNRDLAIAQKSIQNGIDYFGFNNRGSELARYLKKTINGKTEKILAGTGYEDALDGYYDVLGAIKKVKELGYTEIYIQGHSLGSTKTLYTYKKLKEENNEILKDIKGLILLSLVDINTVMKEYLGPKFPHYLEFAENKEKEGHLKYLMPADSFIHPISVRTYLRYLRDYKEIDIDDYNAVSIIDIPVFMRWGTVKEMTIYKPDELVDKVSKKIEHNNKDINCIWGANHSFDNYEEKLAEEIVDFVNKQK
ncbi:MAG: hypothetical protein J5881_05180 [Clostridia bacterium]|nr:hypothetical protein [Clostridia bacterium]